MSTLLLLAAFAALNNHPHFALFEICISDNEGK
jgi:hypothetical protein